MDDGGITGISAPSDAAQTQTPDLGIANTGGIPSTGGTTSTGGLIATGAQPATGGIALTGGSVSTGGAVVRTGGRIQVSCATDGKLDSSVCWYLGATGASCDQTCLTHGGTDANVASHIGKASEGGSLNECLRLVSLLGINTGLINGTLAEAHGMGCYIANLLGQKIPAWDAQGGYTATEKMNSTNRICGCVN